MNAMGSEFIVGIDLGGTKVSAAVFGTGGARLGRVARLPTMARMKRVVTLMNIKRVVKQAKAEAGVSGSPVAIGMGSSGPLDLRRQTIQDKDSLPNLLGFRIGAFCRRELGAPLHLENDAACFTLGEAAHGAGRGGEIVVGVTLGTGFGCGIVIGGEVYSGATNNAGEVAYCRVGARNFDQVGSGDAVERLFGDQLPEDQTRPSARKVGDLAERGDARALRAWSEYGKGVGHAIGTICCVLDPSVVVIGGSVAKRLRLFERALSRSACQVLPDTVRSQLQIRASELGDAAGVTGAAELARARFRDVAPGEPRCDI